MSFSKDVKEELSKQISSARHCRISELAAIISLCGHVKITEFNRFMLKIQTENILLARKCFTLTKTFKINTEIVVRNNHRNNNRLYKLIVVEHEMALKNLQATKLINQNYEIRENFSITSNLVIQNTCCKRAFIRGAFLAAGSISNPKKDYHFEVVVPFKEKAVQLQKITATFNIGVKIIKRKKNYVIYLKEGSQIVDILNVMEAHVSLMELENVRIYKGMRNSINRQELRKQKFGKPEAATKQIEDINYIIDNKSSLLLSEEKEANYINHPYDEA